MRVVAGIGQSNEGFRALGGDARDGLRQGLRALRPYRVLSGRCALAPAARTGDETVRAMLVDRAFYLGVALTGVVNLFNPELILLGGIFARGQDFFLPTVIQTVSQMSFGGMGKRVRIEATSFGWKAGVLGASALALVYFFYQPELLNN